jgi:outer membrane lipoprotein-sorting protein
MRRRIAIPVVLALVLAAVLASALLLTSRSRAATKPVAPATPSAYALLANVASHLQGVKAIHGQFSWKNDVLGQAFTLPAKAPAQLKKLWASGSGEVWYQDGMLRLQVGQGADQMIVGKNGHLLWVYSAQTNTATDYALPSDAGGTSQPHPAGSPGLNIGNLPSGVAGNLGQLLSMIKLNVTQETVGGQAAYVLTVTPTAADTTIGSVNVAFDAKSYVPLRLQVFAKDPSALVLSAEFSNVSYDAIAASEFMPPATAKVVHGTLPAKTHSEQWQGNAQGQKAPTALSLKQAEAQAGFPLLTSSEPISGLAFQDAYVLRAGKAHGKVALLRYGSGAGTVVLVEGQLTAAQEQQALAMLTGLNLAKSATIGTLKGSSVTGEQISTPLLNALVWRSGGVVHIVAGAVPLQELQTFIGALQ